MALDSGAFNKLIGRNDPYIHSDIDNVFEFVNTINEDPSSSVQRDLQNTIQSFSRYAKQLQNYEQELYDFCGVQDYQGLNKKIFGTNSEKDNIIQMIYHILRNPQFIRELVPTVNEELLREAMSVFNNSDKFTDEFYADFLKNDLTIGTLRKAIVQAFEENSRRNYEDINTLMKQLDSNFAASIEQKVTELGVQRLKVKGASSRTAGIKQLAKIILQEKLGDKITVTRTTFMKAFIEGFKRLMTTYNYVLPLEENVNVEDFLRAIGEDIYFRLIKDSNLSPFNSNLIGQLAEYGLGFAVENTQNQIEGTLTIDTRGNKSEKAVAEWLSQITNEDVKIMGFNDPRGQSQSDMVLKLFNGRQQKIYRIQSKNSILDWLENYDESIQSNRPLTIHITDSKNTKELLEKLANRNFLTDEQTAQIAYFLANAVWFNTSGAVHYNKKNDTYNLRKGSRNLDPILNLVDRILTQGIGAFVGITVSEAMQDTESEMKVDINSTNVFWFLGNRTLFPVSQILLAAINIMSKVEQEIESSRLKYILDTKTIKSNLMSAYDLFKLKRVAIGVNNSFLESGNYEDPGLLHAGKEQGYNIMNNLQGHVNLDFQILRILKESSWVFGIDK